MAYRLAELAELVGAEVRGDPERVVEGLRTLDRAGATDLSFVTSSRYRAQASRSEAGALLVGEDFSELAGATDLLVSDNPYHALAQLLSLFHPQTKVVPGIHPTAVVAEGATVDDSAHVGAFAVVGRGTAIGAEVVLHPHVVVGCDCRIEREVVLHPQVVLYDRTEVGARSVVHAGTVVGSDGFGFAEHAGARVKLPQVGRVVIEEDVEIGANSAIDRATLEVTRLGTGTKIDNLVQVGHNVTLGPGCVLCGQVGISGSATLGRGVVMGGQSGVAGHLTVGDGTQVAGKSAVFRSLPPAQRVGGTPAIALAKWRRQSALLGRLEEMKRELHRLTKEVAALRRGDEEGSLDGA